MRWIIGVALFLLGTNVVLGNEGELLKRLLNELTEQEEKKEEEHRSFLEELENELEKRAKTKAKTVKDLFTLKFTRKRLFFTSRNLNFEFDK